MTLFKTEPIKTGQGQIRTRNRTRKKTPRAFRTDTLGNTVYLYRWQNVTFYLRTQPAKGWICDGWPWVGTNGLSLRWYQNHLWSTQREKEFSFGLQLVFIILAVFSWKPTSKTISGILQLQSDLTVKSFKKLLWIHRLLNHNCRQN